MDPQGDAARSAYGREARGAGDVPALREPALRRRSAPTGASFKRADGIVSGRQAHLHRLPLLHDGLSLKARSFVHEEHDDQKVERRAARGR